MKVKVVYRNYKPIHDLYASFRIESPDGVIFLMPRLKPHLRYFLPLHRKLGNSPLLRSVATKVQDCLFGDTEIGADIYHFTQMISAGIPQKPYVVDFEHIVALANFSTTDQSIVQKISLFLGNSQCRRVIPLSQAAHRSLEYLLNDLDYERIASKVEVIYPALPDYYALLKDKVDHSYVNRSPSTLKILFVGCDVYRKGLHELLKAFHELEGNHHNLQLYVISDAPKKLRQKYASKNIKFFEPKFSHLEIIKQFYLPCDLFVLPTHNDSFGMALLYSLSCGTPVLTTRQFATPEIVRSNYNGLFVNSNRLYLEDTPLPERGDRSQFYGYIQEEEALVSDLIGKIEYLHLNRDLLYRMGQQALEDFVPGGKFSIDVRNRKLGEVYRACL